MLREAGADLPNVTRRQLPGPARRLLPRPRHPGDRQGPARGQRLRLRAADGADEPRAGRRRDAVHADGPAGRATCPPAWSSRSRSSAATSPSLVPKAVNDRLVRAREGGTDAPAASTEVVYRLYETVDELTTVIENARSVPMSGSCMVPRDHLLDLLDDLRESLPERGARRPARSSSSAPRSSQQAQAEAERLTGRTRERGRAAARRRPPAARRADRHRPPPARRARRPARRRRPTSCWPTRRRRPTGWSRRAGGRRPAARRRARAAGRADRRRAGRARAAGHRDRGLPRPRSTGPTSWAPRPPPRWPGCAREVDEYVDTPARRLRERRSRR